MNYQTIQNGPITFREHLTFQRRRIQTKVTGVNSRRLALIACFPKSGSTYLMRLMHEITQFPRVYLGEERGANEQDFSASILHRVRYQDGVCNQHVKGTTRNRQLAKAHHLRPVVLVRNIYDVVISLNDHFHNESCDCPTGYVPRGHCALPQEDQLMFVIRFHLPWFFNFLLSWYEAQDELPIYWLSYEQLFQDQKRVLDEVLNFWDISVSREAIEQGVINIQHRDTRLNKGVRGRGASLSKELKQEITSLANSAGLDSDLMSLIGVSVLNLPNVCEAHSP